MSEEDKKNGLKMYPGVSLGSSPQKSVSKFKITLLIIIVIVGASAGGYWINSEFISPSDDSVPIEEITEITPASTDIVPDDDLALDIDLTPNETATEPELVSETQTIITDTSNDLSLDNILEPDEEETVAITEAEEPLAVSEEPSLTDSALEVISDTVDTVAEVATETVSNLVPSTDTTPAGILKAIKEADAALAQGDYASSKAILTNLTSMSESDLGDLAPDVYYRAGLANRYLKDETEAQTNWLRGYKNDPSSTTGRLSALALADTWYYWYVESTQDLSKWEAIRDAYSTAIGMDGARYLSKATEAQIASRLTYLNEKLVFDPTMPVSGAVFHEVEPGEYISTIANNYGLGTWSSIVDINKVDPKNIKVGMKLKLMPGRLFILVDKRNLTLSWYLDGKFIKRYNCATGAVGSETPEGHYEIFKMDAEPNWTDPKTGKVYKYGEEGHAIGSRWLAMRGGSKTGLGIHGTIAPESIGTKASSGCIRLLNKDVEELYGFASIGNNNETEVLIIE